MKPVKLALIILSLSFFVFYSEMRPASHSFGGDEDYSIFSIHPSLLKDAGAVVRLNSVRFEIKDQKRALQKVKIVVTIFNKDQRDCGRLVLPYNKFCKVEELEGRIIDAGGIEIRELESNDIKDYSTFYDFSLYDDNRIKLAELYYDKYPYTIEFSYELSYKGFLDWPTWLSQMSLDPVERSSFEVVTPSKNPLRYWCNNDTLKPKVYLEDGKTVYKWSAVDLPKLSEDVIGEDVEDVAAIVRIAPDDFELDEYKGNMSSWKDFGLWFKNLCKDKDQLPESAKKDVHSIISPSDNTLDKICKLYNYMQSRTRYVSVQLGIGGWQPFDANYVHEKGYGDCKALSNYMIALLKEAGIKAYYVLINNGHHRMPIVKEFPSNQFNHVIVCVPLEKDTLWLECTSQTAHPGQIGWSNENRSALLITDQGGMLVETPVSKAEDNTQIRHAKVEINNGGHCSANVEVKWNGDQQSYVRNSIDEATPEEREKWITSSLNVPDARIENFRLEGIENKSSERSLSLKVNLPRYASVSGSRIFFQPNLMEKRTHVPQDVPQRLSPVRFQYPYSDIDSIYYSIPQGYKIEAIPKEVTLSSSFAGFSSKAISLDNSTILFVRSLKVRNYSVPANNYSEYRKFFSDVVKADRAQIVLIKNN
ncbi:MAG: DUF3857 domain-containing transglutaminase family protein [Bacteroidota bacterium]|nr:DUF3857 domain-containing transglutaminase family protein [Bacteroidota bacterium]